MVKNSAFIFVKPHANTEVGRSVTKDFLAAKGLTVTKEGTITGEEVSEKMLIDNHYYAIASKATILKPKELNVPADKFKEQFGLEWADALAQGVVFNAKDACEELGVDADALDKIWAKCKADKKMIKFGGGFYCGKLEVEGKKTIYAFNGFFMSMRKKFVAPGTSLYYFVAEWDSDNVAWEDFRGKLLGPTDPVTAPEDSLRGMFYKNWEQYGLSEIPNVGDNAVHASASPFEALCERMNWLEAKPEDDEFGAQLLKVIPGSVLDEWKNDPQVTYGVDGAQVKKSLFDTVEDQNSDECLAKLQMVATDMKMRVAAVVVMGGTYYICEKIDSPIERGFEEFEIEPGRAVADLTDSIYRQAKSENEKLVREKAALQPLDRAIGDLMAHMDKRKEGPNAGA